ncbi:MAG: nucleotidyltransferase domain-containing protein [Planctomycetota bacterium]
MDLAALCSQVEPVFRRQGSVILAYLFGSSARGETHRGSDLDLGVFMEDTSLTAYRALWSDLRDVLGTIPFDLVTLNAADPVLCFDVIREGRVLFYRSAEALNEFERRAWHRYQDTRHLRSIGEQYLAERAREWSSKKKLSSSDSSDSKK